MSCWFPSVSRVTVRVREEEGTGEGEGERERERVGGDGLEEAGGGGGGDRAGDTRSVVEPREPRRAPSFLPLPLSKLLSSALSCATNPRLISTVGLLARTAERAWEKERWWRSIR